LSMYKRQFEKGKRMSSLFDKLKSMQQSATEAPVESTEAPVAAPEQCECGSALAGECAECSEPSEQDIEPSVLERLQALGDQKLVNPPHDAEPFEHDEKASENPILKHRKPPEETPQVDDGKTPCPYCRKRFKVLSRHKCPELRQKPMTPEEVQFHKDQGTIVDDVEPEATEAPPALDPTAEMDPIHEDEAESTNSEQISSSEKVLVFTDIHGKKHECVPCEIPDEIVSMDFRKEDIVAVETTVGDIKERVEYARPEESDESPIPEGYELLIDCVPYLNTGNQKATYFPDIIEPIADQVAREFQVPNWGMAPYGQGPTRLAQLLDEYLMANELETTVLMLSGSKEYAACRDVMIANAGRVIMGVRG
jgi:hypothetical protein